MRILKHGDKVKIKPHLEPNKKYGADKMYPNSSMMEYMGTEAEIEIVYPTGYELPIYRLDIDDNCWGWTTKAFSKYKKVQK